VISQSLERFEQRVRRAKTPNSERRRARSKDGAQPRAKARKWRRASRVASASRA